MERPKLVRLPRIVGLDGQKLTRGRARARKKLIRLHAPYIITPAKTGLITPAMMGRGGHGPGARGARAAVPTESKKPATESGSSSGGGSQGGGGVGGPLGWFSDARTGTGTGDTALRDGTKWGNTLFGGPEKTLMSVIATGALGFPSTNVWQVNYLNPRGSPFNYQLQSGIPSTAATLPAVGQYWYLRFYYRSHAMGDLQQAHWLQATNITSWELKHTGNGSTISDFHLVTNDGVGYDDLLNYKITISQDATYRFEMRLFRYVSGQCKVALRMYDSSNNLVADNTTFLSFNGVTTLAVANPDVPVTDADFLNFDMGNNDPGPDALTGNFYVGSFGTRVSASSDAWIGPYRVVPDEN